MKRDSMLFYRTFLDGIDDFDTLEEKFEWLNGIINYGLNGVEFEPSTKSLQIAWRHVKPLIDANIRNYLNGKKGGAPKENKNAVKGKNKAKQTQNNRKTTQNNRKQGNVEVYKDKDKDKEVYKDKEEEVEVEVEVDVDNITPTPQAGKNNLNNNVDDAQEEWTPSSENNPYGIADDEWEDP